MILYTSHLYRTQVYKLTSSSKIFYMAQSIESLAQYWIWEHLVIISFGEGNGNPLQYSCLKNSMDSGAWWAANHRVTQSWTRLKQLSMHACIGEGNGNPLQYSFLENPRDRGAWWAAVYGVAQSWTRLRRLSSSSNRFMYFWFSDNFIGIKINLFFKGKSAQVTENNKKCILGG